MIISASRRTDIPALYSDWFINRLNSGYLYVKNPMNSMQVSKVIFTPETVDCIVFWTKNPAPMLDKLKQIKNIPYYFHFTVTAYDSQIEKNLPAKNTVVDTFKKLSDITGPDRIIWRYDPVFFTSEFDTAKHQLVFEHLAESLSGFTHTCMFSYLTPYNKCKKNMRHLCYTIPGIQDGISFALTLSSIAKSQNITLKSCAMINEFSDAGIVRGRCIDPDLVESISGRTINHRKDPSQRDHCLCAYSIDIGAYNTCTNGCIYCYANYDPAMACKNQALHNPGSELLSGIMTGSEKITVRDTQKKSDTVNDQLKMF